MPGARYYFVFILFTWRLAKQMWLVQGLVLRSGNGSLCWYSLPRCLSLSLLAIPLSFPFVLPSLFYCLVVVAGLWLVD